MIRDRVIQLVAAIVAIAATSRIPSLMNES